MFGSKIKVSDETLEKVRVAAKTLGVSIEDFVDKVLVSESKKVLMQAGNDAVDEKEAERIAEQMRGLGYID